MNKQEMVAAVVSRVAEPKARVAAIVEALFGRDGVIAAELQSGKRVHVAGFGTFEVRPRAARQMRNPHTGKAMNVKASRMPAFRAGKVLKDLVNRR